MICSIGHQSSARTVHCELLQNYIQSLTSLCFSAGEHMFDSPSVVAAAMAGSLAGVMDVISPDSQKTG